MTATKIAKLKALRQLQKKLERAERSARKEYDDVTKKASAASEKVEKHFQRYTNHRDRDGLPIFALPLTDKAVAENKRLRKIAAGLIAERRKAEKLWWSLHDLRSAFHDSLFHHYLPSSKKVTKAKHLLKKWQERKK